MADKQIFPSNTVNSNSWKFTYSDKTTTDYSHCSASTSSSRITIRGDSDTGTAKGIIKGNYLLKVDLTNYKTLKASVSSCSIHSGDAGICQLVVQSVRDINTGVVSSKTILELGKSSESDYDPSINVSGLSGSYYIGINAQVNAYNMGDAYVSVTCDISLVESNYTVKLNKGAGISAVSPKESNSVAPKGSLSINATVSSGYTWSKWTGDTDYLTSAATVKANTVKPTKNVSLKATATGNTYNVGYNKNDNLATGEMKPSTHTYGEEKALRANAFKKTGYSFSGWATSSTGSVVYANQASVKNLTTSAGATVNLYAKWAANTYTIIYNANGGSGSMSSITHTYDTAKLLTKNTFTRKGYMFMGWSTSSSGDVEYADKESVKNLATSGTVTLYAVWMREGTVRIMVDGEYKMAQVYIYDNNWHLAQPYSYVDIWSLCGG